jgi:hypothetical protein
MTTQTALAPAPACTPAQRVTRSLLGYGVLAGVAFEASVLTQGLTRRGFRLAHHDASLLSNGPLGWIQIATFLVAGAMTIACAAGMRRALAGTGHADTGQADTGLADTGLADTGLADTGPADTGPADTGPAGRWGPVLIAVYGAALMAAGLLRADPADGFGPGAPAGKAAHISWHAAGHLVSAGVGFIALIVACFAVARYFGRGGHRGLAVYSRVSGLAFLAAFAGVTTGSSSSAVVLPFYAGVLIAWTWLAVTSVHLYRHVR